MTFLDFIDKHICLLASGALIVFLVVASMVSEWMAHKMEEKGRTK